MELSYTGTDDLYTLQHKQDHWNILQYIRVHKLREPELVVRHGLQLLCGNNNNTITTSIEEYKTKNVTTTTSTIQFNNKYKNKIGYYTILEQICLAALDCSVYTIAEQCLLELESNLQLVHRSSKDNNDALVNDQQQQHLDDGTTNSISLSSTSIRYQLLRARYYEAIHDIEKAQQIYDTLLLHNPCNPMIHKRIYSICKSQVNQHIESIQLLNKYISDHSLYNDSTTWYELYQRYNEVGQYTYSIYCLHHVLYIVCSTRIADMKAIAQVHIELAECYISTIDQTTIVPVTVTSSTGKKSSSSSSTSSSMNNIETILTARKHMSIAIELNPHSIRAKFGLIVISNMYLLYTEPQQQQPNAITTTKDSSSSSSDDRDNIEHEMNVSKELIRYCSEQIRETVDHITYDNNNKNINIDNNNKEEENLVTSSIHALLDEYIIDL